MRTAFEELRRRLLVYHFDPELPTKLETDSSDGVIAGILSQEHPDGQWYSIGFYSHAGAEANWEILDKELAAIIRTFEKWRPELMSCQYRVSVYTDHRSLEYFVFYQDIDLEASTLDGVSFRLQFRDLAK